MEYRAGLGSRKAQAQAKRRECSKWENQEVKIVEEPTHPPSFTYSVSLSWLMGGA